MTMRMLAGAAAVAALIATPAIAQSTQQRFAGPQHMAADSTGARTTTRAGVSGVYDTRAYSYNDRRYSDRYYNDRRSGFWPGDFAAGVVGGAIGTAGAIATVPFAPFRGDSYAYYRDTTTMPNRGYIADANGPKCLPGTMTTINGREMLCQ